jgi:hypothetical protein
MMSGSTLVIALMATMMVLLYGGMVLGVTRAVVRRRKP